MRILLVSDYAAEEGGAEIVTRQLRDGLRARGHDVRWFSSNGRRGGTTSEADVECFGTLGPLRTLHQQMHRIAAARLPDMLDGAGDARGDGLVLGGG